MKIAVLNDTHAGCRGSSDIFINYQRRFYEEVFFPHLKENDITEVIHLGDYYDNRKTVNIKAIDANRKMFLDPMESAGITMNIIPGNHDVYYKSTNQVCSLYELMGRYENVNIIDTPTDVDYDGCKIALVPWINNINYAEYVSFIKKSKASVLGGHLELNGFEMMKGITNTHGMEVDIFKRFEQVYSGHFHTKSSQGNITYLGSQMEFTWADADDPKFFHVYDTETREMVAVRNPITMHQKIYYNDENDSYEDFPFNQLSEKFVKIIVVKKTDPYLFDGFVDRVQDSGIYELKIAETFDEFTGSSVDDDSISIEDTTTLLDSYVESVDTDLDKNRIKGIMRSLYTEASNLEIA
jgi:DNA repair exonuclease SbcCD nuclease subunit